MGSDSSGHRVMEMFLWGDGNVLELDSGDDYTTL